MGKPRNSSIELLRILAMLMIVAFHFTLKTPWQFPSEITIDQYFLWTFNAFGKIGVSIFFIIMGYFLYRARDLSWKKVFRITRPVWFYSIAIFIFVCVFYPSIGQFDIRSVLISTFPVVSGAYWFVTAYVILYLLRPYIKLVLDRLTKKRLLHFILMLLLIENIIFYFGFILLDRAVPIPSSYTALAGIASFIIYIAIGYYIAKYKIKKISTVKLMFKLSVLAILASPLITLLLDRLGYENLSSWSSLWGDSTFLTVMASTSIFILVSRLAFNSRIINYLGGLMFGVYLIHDNGYVVSLLWRTLVKRLDILASPFVEVVGKSLIVILTVFIVCAALEALRQFVAKLLSRTIHNNTEQVYNLKVMLKNSILLMRPKHYMKNGLIFVPLIFSGQLFQSDLLSKSAWAFLLFSLIASIVYIVNDVHDIDKDKKHPKKKHRPLASGAITIRHATILAIILLCAAIAIGFSIGLNFVGWLFLATYLVINLAYSFGLKNVPILDVSILAAGFLLRILFGGAVVGIEVSHWLYMTVLAGAFYLGLGKRRNEVITNGTKSRKVNELYPLGFLDKTMYVCLSLVMVFYSLWATDDSKTGGGSYYYLTIPILLVIFMIYSLNIEKSDSSGDPVDVVTSNKPLMALIAIFVFIAVGLKYI